MKDIIPLIYEGVARHEALQPVRGYLGMSAIGNPCELQSWFSFRQTSGALTDGRVLMLFETGKHVEMIVCRALRLAGIKLKGAYPDEQIAFSDHGGFFSGHPDGICEDETGEMILEIKSANTNKFKDFQTKGVQQVYPAYYAQMQLYMHYSGLQRALFLVMKKDDSSLYSEIVSFDSDCAKANIEKASRIIQTHHANGSISIPLPISSDPKSDFCKWCRYQVTCFSPDESLQSVHSCRSCAYLNIGKDFIPKCGHRDHKIILKNISLGCLQWQWVCRTPFSIEAEA